MEGKRTIEIRARVRHTKARKLAAGAGPIVYHTGVLFVAVTEVSGAAIENILIDDVRRRVAEWETSLPRKRRGTVPPLGRTPGSDKPIAYLWYQYADGEWTRSASQDPNQPIDGFAVCDDEDPGQIALLCKAYERYSENDRYMVRLLAHVAIAERKRAHGRTHNK